MNCINCNSSATKVVNSRKSGAQRSVWRRRQCRACQTVFTTSERVDLSQRTILKQNGHTERFSLFKLQLSIWKALANQNRSTEAEELSLTILSRLSDMEELTTSSVREVAHQVLSNYDPKAALRYNSF